MIPYDSYNMTHKYDSFTYGSRLYLIGTISYGQYFMLPSNLIKSIDNF